MFNPFVLFTRPLLDAFVASGKTFFIRQCFEGARPAFPGSKGTFLLTHYAEIGHAQHHYGAISTDPYKYLYDWRDPSDQQRLMKAASQPEGYKIFASVFAADWKKLITGGLKQKLRDYIEHGIGKKPSASDGVDFDIYVHYGELYTRFTLRNQEVRVKLNEIENFR